MPKSVTLLDNVVDILLVHLQIKFGLVKENEKQNRDLKHLHIYFFCIQEELSQAREAAEAAAVWWRTRETKADATLRQQAKLIDFLQVCLLL